MNVMLFTISIKRVGFSGCDVFRNSRSFPPFLEELTVFTHFGVKNLR
ncbi:hypothetical protein HMPREF3212_00457 [Citrobacter freundii]|nr:hypothetical protein HMPREF3212_00457 [Citrobacter freundii]